MTGGEPTVGVRFMRGVESLGEGELGTDTADRARLGDSVLDRSVPEVTTLLLACRLTTEEAVDTPGFLW